VGTACSQVRQSQLHCVFRRLHSSFYQLILEVYLQWGAILSSTCYVVLPWPQKVYEYEYQL